MRNLIGIIIVSLVLISCSNSKREEVNRDYSMAVDEVFGDWSENEPGASIAIFVMVR